MKISKLIVKNFKSFNNLEFINDKNHQKLGDVNILVGANASGKTNFIQIFEFLKEIKKNGIEKTIKTKYKGINNIKNFNTNKKNISIEIELTLNEKTFIRELNENDDIFRIRTKILYKIILIQLPANKYDIQEKITFYEKFILINEKENKNIDLINKEHIYGFENNYGKFKLFTNNKDIEKLKLTGEDESYLDLSFPFPISIIENLNSRYKNKSILEYGGVLIPENIFDFGIFDFEPKKSKGAKDDIDTDILDKTGIDLIPVIKQILTDEENAKLFNAKIITILDFVEDIKIVETMGQIDMLIKESCNNKLIESKLLSDGTVSIISIIVALFYQKNSIIFVEEPEHGIHPSLIASVIDKIYSVTNKQIILTTHSPEILRQANLNDIYILDKEDCFSTIENIRNKEMVANFLNQKLGIDELFIDNLLND